jgi:hypothetical protein
MLRWGPWVIYAFTAVLGRPAFAQTNPSVAFFYGKPVPVGQLGRFDWVVVEPDHLDARGLDELQRAGVQVFAYLSLGEAAPEAIDPGWILGRNAPWGSVIVDPRAAEWRSRILARVDALAARGFHGLFLDTLDSYAMVLRADARRAAAVAMASLIRDISDHHRDVKLLFNRGFELLDDVGGRASAVAAESLYGWDAAAKRYVDVPTADRAWLTRELVEGRTPDDCEQGAAGAVVPFADPDAVAHAALALLGDPARWRAAQQAAIRRVETHCTEARVFDACRRIYEEAHTWHA